MRGNASHAAVYAVALLLFLGGAGYLVWSGFSQGSMYFLDISEVRDLPEDPDRRIRMFGTVLPSGLQRSADGMFVRCVLQDRQDPNQKMYLEYHGALPDAFKAGAEVIVEGSVSSGIFRASTLMTKCPSKYQKDNRI